jgi:preprotein translocase subunit YajC
MVSAVQEDAVTLQIADGVRVRFSREAVQTVVEPSAGS